MTPEFPVFISYAAQDASVARDVCARLEAEGIRCWIAPRDIEAGRDWSAAIPLAIDASKALVLILSTAAVVSRQIAHEVHLAHTGGRPIVPFRIEPVEMEGALRYLLSGIHYIDAAPDARAAAMDQLTRVLGTDPQAGNGPVGTGDRRTPTNLPLSVSSFIGRATELAQLREALENARLLTLTGTGGVGKSRLAYELARASMERFPDGVWLADCSLLAEPEAVSAAAAAAVPVRPAPGQSAADALVHALRDKRVLLLFDGCDRVRDATAGLVQTILAACANASVLATSRQALDAPGETVRVVGPLDAGGALELFEARAKAVASTFTVGPELAATVAGICRRLDGIPLAIELAAAKMRVIGVRQLDEKLRERFRILSRTGHGALPHQQTLRATIDWSFDLLEEPERALFRRLAVFAGGCMLDAAARVCDDDGAGDEWDTLERLSSLVDKSLVVAEPSARDPRYRMLNSIRDYAFERLTQAGESRSFTRAFVAYVAGFVSGLYPLAHALEDVAWRESLAVELDNVRAAIEATIFGDDAAAGIELLAFIEFPELVTTPQEALRWFEAAASLAHAMPDALAHARILRHCVLLEWLTGRPLAEREEPVRRGLDVALTTNDADEIARAHANLGGWLRSAARFEEADRAFAAAYADAERLSPLHRNAVLRQWAVTDLQRGEVELARRRFSDVARFERAGSEAHASALLNLGELEFAAGNVEGAREAARGAKDTYARLDSVYRVLLLANLGAYALAAGDVDDARGHLAEALELLVRHGTGRAWLGGVLEHHALLAGLTGDHERAARLAGFTQAYYVASGEVRERTEQHGYERLVALLENAYAAEELGRRLSDGAALTKEEALAEAATLHSPHVGRPRRPS